MEALQNEAVYKKVKSLYEDGTPPDDIVAFAQAQGLSIQETEDYLDSLEQAQLAGYSSEGSRTNPKVIWGLLLAGAGLFFSFYVDTGLLFYGAIISGVVLFFRGLTEDN